ncbi:MAG: hypothetical protein KGH79_03070 [Patescibacteria group bacterium]|nr:hypothetical protein [Patescibacteria group bacterium]
MDTDPSSSQPPEEPLPSTPRPEPEWQSDEGDLRIELQPKKEEEWQKLARDLKEKGYLAKDVNIEEFLEECRQFVSVEKKSDAEDVQEEEFGLSILHAAKTVGAPFSTMLLASAVLVREAEDLNLMHEELAPLNERAYVSCPTKNEKSSLTNDVGELVAWVASILDKRPQRMRKEDVDKFLIDNLTPRLSELAVLCYCKKKGWLPVYEKPEDGESILEDPDR